MNQREKAIKMNEEETKETFDLVKMFVLHTVSWQKNKSKPMTAQFLAINSRGQWVQLLPPILRKA